MGRSCTTRAGLHFLNETERYVNNLNIYNRSKNGTNLWDDLIYIRLIPPSCSSGSNQDHPLRLESCAHGRQPSRSILPRSDALGIPAPEHLEKWTKWLE